MYSGAVIPSLPEKYTELDLCILEFRIRDSEVLQELYYLPHRIHIMYL